MQLPGQHLQGRETGANCTFLHLQGSPENEGERTVPIGSAPRVNLRVYLTEGAETAAAR